MVLKKISYPVIIFEQWGIWCGPTILTALTVGQQSFVKQNNINWWLEQRIIGYSCDLSLTALGLSEELFNT